MFQVFLMSLMELGLQTILLPVAIGYQEIYVDAGLAETTGADTTTNAKTVGTSSGVFDGNSMSIAFNVNDDLSISYAETEETHRRMDSSTTTDVEQSSESLQIAYSMEVMSIKAYSTEILIQIMIQMLTN